MKHGTRTALPDMVVHVRRDTDDPTGPRVGLIITKRVGSAVDRHRVARRLRHVVRPMLTALHPCDQVVIRALPSSRRVSSAWLEQQVRTGLQRAVDGAGTDR
ncbi:ribonuclease P protein component [Mycobacterium shinjukuense]|uniref:Ribonuclease P protein component n=1 Tax=Mycobacterium shinjukuense TaxID=398694 RepID=A0A7I7MVT6_9MYCO|nr:ribonuclease P protein component [Mycobacterium shinjukuense]